MNNKVLWFFIFLVIGFAIVWAVGFFISMDALWFIHTLVGRVLAVFFGIIVIIAAVEQAEDM